MSRWTWRRAATAALAVLAVLAATAPGAVAAAPPRTTHAVLTTGTRIEWTGVTGLRLTVAEGARLPAVYGALLYLRGGTYAGARLVWTGTCDEATGERCSATVMEMDYTHRMRGHFNFGAPPGSGRDHVGHVSNSGRLPSGTLDLYLFTDGRASLVFDDTGLARRAQAFTAAGRVRATFRKLPEFCGTDHCSPGSGYAGRAHTGGAYGDVGRWGKADGWVANYSTSKEWVPNSHGVRGCAYTAAPDATGVPERDHPLGCDLNPEYVDGWTMNYATFGSPQYSGVWRDMGTFDTRGRVYMGFIVSTAHDKSEAIQEAYGLWWEHGIR